MCSFQLGPCDCNDVPFIHDVYRDAFPVKLKNNWRRIGIEEEFAVVNLDGTGGEVSKIFPDLISCGWLEKHDPVTGALVGVTKDEIEVGLDVGIYQLEIGFPPKDDLLEHVAERERIFALVDDVLHKYGLVRLSDYGAHPVTVPHITHWADKGRGNFFKKFFCDLVHAQTSSSSSQIHLDVTYSELVPALQVLNSLAGPLIGLGANSPVWGGGRDPDGMIAARQVFWYRFLENYGFWNNIFIGQYLENPQGALGMLPRSMEELMCFIASTKFLVGVEDGVLYTPNILFKDWALSQRHLTQESLRVGLLDHEATIWWDARPRVAYGTIEVRPGCQGKNAVARHAFCLGLVSNLFEALELVNQRSYREWRYMKFDALRNGMYARGGIVEASKQAVGIARKGLLLRERGEEVLLDFDEILSQERPESPGHAKLRVFEEGGMNALLEILLK